MAEEEEKPIRVVDRRMFTPEGDLRPDYRPPDEAPAEPAPPPRPAAAPPAPAASDALDVSDSVPEPPPPRPDEDHAPAEPRGAFALLVQMLAMPAYASLGLVPDPSTGRQRVDRTAAREMIDLLGVLEQKTRGNLSFEESNFLSRVLYDLRLAFVEVSRPPAK